MNNWKIATINTRGLNNPEKQQDIIKWHQHNQHTISIIMETRLKPPTAQFLKKQHPDILQLHTTDPNNPNGLGVGIIINRLFAPHIHQITEVPGRCITIHLKFTGKITLTITGIYNQANKDKNTAHSIIKHLQHQHQHSTHSIIGGDFNEPITKPRILLKWIKKMKYINLAKILKQDQTSTWTNGIIHSTIDFIWTSHSLATHTNQFTINSSTQFFNSDHKVITTQINLTSIIQHNHSNLKRKRRKIFDLTNIEPEKWHQWQVLITNQITNHPNQNHQAKTLNQNWQYIHNLIHTTAKKAFKQKEIPRKDSRYSHEESDLYKAEKALSKFIKQSDHHISTLQSLKSTHPKELEEIIKTPKALQTEVARTTRKAIRKARYLTATIKQQ